MAGSPGYWFKLILQCVDCKWLEIGLGGPVILIEQDSNTRHANGLITIVGER